jgi:hypothetical protein
MSIKFVPACHILLITLLLTLVLPSIAMADGQAGAATPLPEPTTLGKITVKTSPTIYLMLIGACIVGSGGMLIFLRYSK